MSEYGTAIGFAPEEIDPTTSTRSARLKWVVVVNSELPPGRAVNAAVCTAVATAKIVTGLLGEDAFDADGTRYSGLPWTGCSILVADAARLRAIRAKAAASPGCHVSDMPAIAQQIRVYADFLATMKEIPTEEMDFCAIGIVGPRNRIDKLVGKLPLMP
ncbi:DUF2000 domain-containing protein [Amycolatopsis regifaucium]|uniref:DUF2000 domain-containing protein n=1 Tax=Amycolatopsis regifaucium TaxID=546365 RepID=A0A154MJB2_9PSEU|nr:DUF2000 domain-containing protein [Amycolatopsis regifaucium]KZB84425.1 hypothetical protein AVL48_32025 [Amycolatopsis regifaucium]OKA10888.1 hypothetical protein ATP06_0201690 [Amycolatopsis regifaucium]SFI21073.1 Protein of unknown function [Amycolatopsis regifaucium]